MAATADAADVADPSVTDIHSAVFDLAAADAVDDAATVAAADDDDDYDDGDDDDDDDDERMKRRNERYTPRRTFSQNLLHRPSVLREVEMTFSSITTSNDYLHCLHFVHIYIYMFFFLNLPVLCNVSSIMVDQTLNRIRNIIELVILSFLHRLH